MFFGQKLKCAFFKDYDKGTRFFHSLMNQRHRRHHIPAIVRSNGMLTSSAEEVGREFVSYYKELLGTSKLTIPLRAEVVQNGTCINVDSHDFLLALVSTDDIKQVLFSMDDNKAPGPDGYTSLPSLKKLGTSWVKTSVQLLKTSLPQRRFSSSLIILSKPWFQNQLMPTLLQITDPFLAATSLTRLFPSY